MKLSEIQTTFQSAVLAGTEPRRAAILDSIGDGPRADRATLFDVYVDAYRLRLADFVSNDFPVLRCHLGDEAFGRLVEDYVSWAPSRQRNARWYASSLPDFMRETAPWRTSHSACDLAQFERALADAFDAPDAPALGLDALGNVRVEDWPRLAFEFHPSVRVLDLATGTDGLYQCLVRGGEPTDAGGGEETILFWRSDDQSVYRDIGEAERLAFREAKHGKQFGDICTLLAFQNDDACVTQQVAGFLSQWFADGLVVRAFVAE